MLYFTEGDHIKDTSIFETDETSSIKEVDVYVTLDVSGFHPRIYPNAE